MWNKDEIRGKFDKAKGRVKEEAGEMTKDEDLRNEGAEDRVSGGIQENIGKGRRKAGEAIEDVGEKLKR